MSDLQTQSNDVPVTKFLTSIENKKRQEDGWELIELMRETTGVEPMMWGPSIVGFGSLHYKYASGREGDTVAVGFAPRKQALVLYGVLDYDQNRKLAKKLGRHTAGKGCLYIKDLADVDARVLRQMVKLAFDKRNNS